MGRLAGMNVRNCLRSLLLLGLVLLGSCRVLPEVVDKPVSHALAVPKSGPLVKASRNLASDRASGESSFLLLADAGEALKWRLALIDSARSSIDIQLYLWHDGASSALLFERLLQAADRGVRVRLLVDDFLFVADDARIATLSRNHPHFKIRIFNPGYARGSSLASFTEMLTNFKELNRRMHNKTFTADRCLTIVGGRNIGDHYYGMDEHYNFIDLDVLAAGPVVAEVSDGFDEFWNATAAYPGASLSDKNLVKEVAESRAKFRETIEEERDGKLRDYPNVHHDWSRELAGLRRKMVAGRARFLQDDPEPEHDRRVVAEGLFQMTERQDGQIQLASPYLLPSNQGIERVRGMVEEGLVVDLLVPSLAANNQAVVDGHYRKSRRRLVESSSQLSEFRADPSEEVRALADVGPVRSKRVTLHLKAVVGDRDKCFIGSLNLDPRAIQINTESGLMIKSPELAGQLADLLDTLSNEQNSWRVSMDKNGRLLWQSRGETRRRPPPAKWRTRMLAWIAGLLPIRDQI